MDAKLSACHNAAVVEKDGKTTCGVCGSECEVAGVQASGNNAGNAPAPKVGDKCTLEDGSEGIIAGDGACVPTTTQEQMPKVGDACEIEGKPGVFEQGADGLVCVPAEKIAE